MLFINHPGSRGLRMRRLGPVDAMRSWHGIVHFGAIIFAAGCTSSADWSACIEDVQESLDRWHTAASSADEKTYLELFAPDGVFLGTAEEERWEERDWREFVHTYFSQGRGWTYRPHDRHVSIASDRKLAWFDERLTHDKYGELRGTGLLRKDGAQWKIVQYNLTFPVPNEITPEVVRLIREFQGMRSGPED